MESRSLLSVWRSLLLARPLGVLKFSYKLEHLYKIINRKCDLISDVDIIEPKKNNPQLNVGSMSSSMYKKLLIFQIESILSINPDHIAVYGRYFYNLAIGNKSRVIILTFYIHGTTDKQTDEIIQQILQFLTDRSCDFQRSSTKYRCKCGGINIYLMTKRYQNINHLFNTLPPPLQFSYSMKDGFVASEEAMLSVITNTFPVDLDRCHRDDNYLADVIYCRGIEVNPFIPCNDSSSLHTEFYNLANDKKTRDSIFNGFIDYPINDDCIVECRNEIKRTELLRVNDHEKLGIPMSTLIITRGKIDLDSLFEENKKYKLQMLHKLCYHMEKNSKHCKYRNFRSIDRGIIVFISNNTEILTRDIIVLILHMIVRLVELDVANSQLI